MLLQPQPRVGGVSVHVKSLGIQYSVITASEGCSTESVKGLTVPNTKHFLRLNVNHNICDMQYVDS